MAKTVPAGAGVVVGIGTVGANLGVQFTGACPGAGMGGELSTATRRGNFYLCTTRAALVAGDLGYGYAPDVSDTVNVVKIQGANATAGAGIPTVAQAVDVMCLEYNFRQFNGTPFARNAGGTPLHLAQSAVLKKATAIATVACPGARIGDYVLVQPRTAPDAGLIPVAGYVAAANVVSVAFMNVTTAGGAASLPAGAAGLDYDVLCIPQNLRRHNGLSLPKTTVAVPLNVAQNTVLLASGLHATAVVPGARPGCYPIVRPLAALEAGYGIAGACCTVANQVQVNFINPTAGNLPAAAAGQNFEVMCLPSNYAP